MYNQLVDNALVVLKKGGQGSWVQVPPTAPLTQVPPIWAGNRPTRIIRPVVKTVGRQPTNKGSIPLLSAKTLVYESANIDRNLLRQGGG